MAVRVLIVDDDPTFRRIAARLLADRGYEVVADAATLADARTALRRIAVDAVLLDVNLPDGSGLTLADDLRRTDPAPRVLLTSSDGDAGPRRLVERCGAAGFVAKDELVAADLSPYLR